MNRQSPPESWRTNPRKRGFSINCRMRGSRRIAPRSPDINSPTKAGSLTRVHHKAPLRHLHQLAAQGGTVFQMKLPDITGPEGRREGEQKWVSQQCYRCRSPSLPGSAELRSANPFWRSLESLSAIKRKLMKGWRHRREKASLLLYHLFRV